MALRTGYTGVISRLVLNRYFITVAPSSRRSIRNILRARQNHCYANGMTIKTGHALRNYSSSPPDNVTEVHYDQLKKIVESQAAVVIDVREPWELREYGSIPGSINVPLGQVNVALQLDPEEFKDKYGGDLPQHTDNIVFSCLAGIRSLKALNTAVSLGYKDVRHYPGGWQDWAKNKQLN